MGKFRQMFGDFFGQQSPFSFARIWMLVTGLGLLLLIAFWSNSQKNNTTAADLRRDQAPALALDLSLKVDEYNRALNQMAQIRQQIEAETSLLKSAKENAYGMTSHKRIEQRLAVVEARLNATQGNFDTLNSLLGDDPTRRMSVVLLNRDIQELKGAVAKDITTLQQEYRNDLATDREQAKSNSEYARWAIGVIAGLNVFAPIIAVVIERWIKTSKPA